MGLPIPPSIPSDKWDHALVGLIIFSATSFLIAGLGSTNYFIALAVTLLAGILKELYDKYIKKTFFDWMDVMATISMATVAFIVLEFVKLLF